MLRLNIPAMYDLLERENRETLCHDNTIDDTIDSCRGFLRESGPHGSSAEVLRGYFEEICIPVFSALRIGGALIRELNGRFSSLIGSVFPDISAKVLDEEELSGMIGAFNTAIERLIAFTESAPEAAPFFSSSLASMKGLRDAADELLAAFLGFSEETEGFFTEAGTYIAEIRNIAATYSSVSFGQDEEGMLFFRIGEGERCYDAASLRQAFSRTLGTLGSHNGLFELECLKNAPSFAPIASSVRTITKKMTVGEASAFGLYAYGDDSVKEVLSKDPQVIYAEDYADGRDIPGHAVALSRMGLRDGDISDVAYELSYHAVENGIDRGIVTEDQLMDLNDRMEGCIHDDLSIHVADIRDADAVSRYLEGADPYTRNVYLAYMPGSGLNAIEKAKVYLATVAMDKRLHTWFDLSGQLFACTGTDSEAHAPSAYMYGFGANELADSLERKLSGAAGAAYVRGRAPV